MPGLRRPARRRRLNGTQAARLRRPGASKCLLSGRRRHRRGQARNGAVLVYLDDALRRGRSLLAVMRVDLSVVRVCRVERPVGIGGGVGRCYVLVVSTRMVVNHR